MQETGDPDSGLDLTPGLQRRLAGLINLSWRVWSMGFPECGGLHPTQGSTEATPQAQAETGVHRVPPHSRGPRGSGQSLEVQA